MSWFVKGKEINEWSCSNTRKSQEILPLLIRKLILATVRVNYIHIPAGDSILTGGWDGILDVEKGNAFVPDGKSFWEFGTNRSIQKKANDEYKKRTESLTDIKVSFVFATTKTWAKKTKFEEEKNKEKKWKEVRGINSDDLEAWLELAPAVHKWFAQIIGKRPENIIDIEQAYSQWSFQTKINLIPELVLTSREEQTKQLLSLLSSNPTKINIKSQSEQESFAFVLASLKDQIQYASRSLIVKSQEQWDNLIESNNSLILIAQSFTPYNIGLAIQKGHSILEMQEINNTFNSSTDLIDLPKIRKSFKTSVLENMGLSHSKAWRVLNDTKGFLHAIVKHPLLEPHESNIPDWSSVYSIDVLSTILFINSWDRDNSNDIKILEMLSNLSYKDFEKKLFLLKEEKDTPLRLIGNNWQVISKINLWDIIAKRIPISQIDKLKTALMDVFSEINPKFDLAPQDRWSAFNKQLNYSKFIRESTADTVALISCFGNQQLTYSSDIKSTIDLWLKELYESDLHVKTWYSYGHQLILLAEASPESFLNALEKTLENHSETKIEELFISGGNFGGCFHCDLLWALETASWNTDYLVRVVSILAELYKFEIESNLNNQPFNSLKQIFLGWINYSSITYNEKIIILENILLRKYPETIWKLLIELLPENHMVGSEFHQPKYQDWAELKSNEVNRSDYFNYYQEINRLIINNKSITFKRWSDIFNNVDKLFEKYFFDIIEKFLNLDKNTFTSDEQTELSIIIRYKIHNNRKFSESDWAISEKWVKKLEDTYYFIEPDSLINKYKYLFESWFPPILSPAIYNDNMAYKEEEKKINELRFDAVSTIIKESGSDELIKLIKIVNQPHFIGISLSKMSLDKSQQNQIISWLNNTNKSLVQTSRTYLQIINKNGDLKIDISIFEKWENKQVAEFLLALPFNSNVFNILKKLNIDIQKYYWQNQASFLEISNDDASYVNWILEQFYIYKKSWAAIRFFEYILRSHKTILIDIDIQLVHDLIIQLATEKSDKILDKYKLIDSLKFLQKSSIEKHKIESIEWLYILINDFNPINLKQKVIAEPDFFVDLVSWVWSPKNNNHITDKLNDEQIRNRAKMAYKLLDKLSLSHLYNNEHMIDKILLRDWIMKTKTKFKEIDRVNIGDDQIGKFLSSSPVDSDGIWPHKKVREVLEEFLNEKLKAGFLCGKRNQRGVTTRAYDEGGEQEYELAEKYKKDAENLKFSNPKTSSILKTITEIYKNDGKREDIQNEIE